MRAKHPQDGAGEFLVLLVMRTLPQSSGRIEAGPGDLVATTESGDTHTGALRLNERKDAGFRSEQNRMAFFRFFTEYREMP